ncbi:cell division suppressor protein YneA [Alteribacter natronophilus]|uniref:cell division suppressor protein YneA n=1 Tax=Alteribacter natronophilus TaxID=2583810 RepID=UPI00110D3D60|nr:LysM peptidoglycan-binding domain-containing protein [Alteribacter natronophilus]TMW73303.1 LysM peptidoglycan-binding domain-containing protein [Alteribacter natronophilus]
MNKLMKQYGPHVFTAGIILLFILVTTMPTESRGLEVDEHENVVVAPGETLWTIASQLHHDLDTNKENVIHWITVHNELEGSVIYAGQELTVPVKGAE